MLLAVIGKPAAESEGVHKRLAGWQAALKGSCRDWGHGMHQLAGVLPAHRLPDGDRERTMLMGLTQNRDRLTEAASKVVQEPTQELTLFEA